MGEIKPGDYIAFPKGTPIYWNGSGRYESVRRQTKCVREVVTERREVLICLLTDEERMRMERYASGPRREGSYREARESFLDSIADEVLARHAGKTPCLLMWSDEGVLLDDAAKVDMPVPKAKPPTKMQQMVEKSVWRVTKTIDIHIPITNPAHTAEFTRLSGVMRASGLPWQEQQAQHTEAMRKAGLPELIEIPYLRLEEGTEIVVAGKRTQFIYFGDGYDYRYAGNSFLYPFKVPASGATWIGDVRHKSMMIPYDRIGEHIEAVHVPLTRAWVLRDRETGNFFKEADSRWRGDALDNRIVMVPTYKEARKFKDLGLLKTSIMDWTGYHAGMPENVNDRRPDWMQYGSTDKIADLPPTFEAVCYDKYTKELLPDTTDIQEWNRRLWKLRDLTINYGSIVRKLYNDIDKKGEVEQFSYILALRTPIDEKFAYIREFEPEEIAAFEEIIERSELTRKDMRRGRNDHSIAVAVRDPDIAFQMKMFYGGPLRMSVLNMRTLEEEVR